MKILWIGPIWNPTGISTAGREMVNALRKMGHQVQVTDPWHSHYDFNLGKEDWNNSIDVDKDCVTVFWDYPHHWRNSHGKIFGGFVHEGTRLFPGWEQELNKADVVWVPSQATKNMFRWNGVIKDIHVIPHGVDVDIYKPSEEQKNKDDAFVFLSINSWTGKPYGDRKGTELLLKAFNDEFKHEENVKLLLKVSTFWKQRFDVYQSVVNVIGGINPNIMVNQEYVDEKELVTYYQKSDCFVAPTRGEGFGLTILNSLACGCPTIVTKDPNSGHMDYSKGNPGVLWVNAPTTKQGDPEFYCEGNMLAEPDIMMLRRQMRWAFENRDKLKEMGKEASEIIRKEWTWENSANQLIKMIEEQTNGKEGVRTKEEEVREIRE